jgi:hypothetical protein
MDLRILNLPELRRIYAVSNTPSYLLRHFRREPSVKELADSSTASELYSCATRPASRRTLDGLTTAYACLAALTFKRTPDIERLAKPDDLADLDWGWSVLEAWRRQSKPTTVLHGHGLRKVR